MAVPSKLALLCLCLAIVVKFVYSFVSASLFVYVAFWIVVIVGMFIMFLSSKTKKTYPSIMNYNTHHKISLASFVGVIGLLVAFVSDILNIYYYYQNGENSVGKIAVLLFVISVLLSLISAVCFIIISASYSMNKSYDFKKLGVLNISPLLWLMTKCMYGIFDVGSALDISDVSLYVSATFGMLAFMNFTLEIDGNDTTSSKTLFSFRVFSFMSILCLICHIVDIIPNGTVNSISHFLFAISLFLVSVFFYFLSLEITKKTKQN